ILCVVSATLSGAAASFPTQSTRQLSESRWRRMIDFNTTQVRVHRRNIERYCRLLATDLTELERQYLHKRIAEEHAQLEQLEKETSPSTSADNARDKQMGEVV